MRKKKLTKKSALRICADLWDWLSKNSGMEKYQWPEWNNILSIYYIAEWADAFYFYCPCCEYLYSRGYTTVKHQDCRAKCPLTKLWPEGCTEKSSPFDKWERTDSLHMKKKYARQIRDGALEELSKIK